MTDRKFIVKSPKLCAFQLWKKVSNAQKSFCVNGNYWIFSVGCQIIHKGAKFKYREITKATSYLMQCIVRVHVSLLPVFIPNSPHDRIVTDCVQLSAASDISSNKSSAGTNCLVKPHNLQTSTYLKSMVLWITASVLFRCSDSRRIKQRSSTAKHLP